MPGCVVESPVSTDFAPGIEYGDLKALFFKILGGSDATGPCANDANSLFCCDHMKVTLHLGSGGKCIWRRSIALRFFPKHSLGDDSAVDIAAHRCSLICRLPRPKQKDRFVFKELAGWYKRPHPLKNETISKNRTL
jgi:hypothetical protein